MDTDHVSMIPLYCYVQRENDCWHLPTGGVKAGETSKQAVQRELQKEIGYVARRLHQVSTYYTFKSVCDEMAQLYLGYGLVPAALPPDETEFFECATLPFAAVLEQVLHSEIRDSSMAIAVCHAARLRGIPL